MEASGNECAKSSGGKAAGRESRMRVLFLTRSDDGDSQSSLLEELPHGRSHLTARERRKRRGADRQEAEGGQRQRQRQGQLTVRSEKSARRRADHALQQHSARSVISSGHALWFISSDGLSAQLQLLRSGGSRRRHGGCESAAACGS